MNRKTPPLIKDALDFSLELKPFEYAELRNGIPVYLVNAGEQDVVQLEFVFFAGNQFEEKNAVATAANYLLKNGTRTRSAFKVSEDFDYYGAYCNRYCYNETALVTLHSLTRYMEKVLPVLRDMFSESTMPEEELNIFKQNGVQRLKVNLLKGDFVANREINKLLYGANHPYGKFNSIEDLEMLEQKPVFEFYDKYYRTGKCAIFVAGKLKDDTLSLLEKFFGDLPWQKPDFEPVDVPVSPAVEKKFRIENDPASVQGAIRIARSFPNRHHPDFRKTVVLNAIFGGYFGSRLMSNIREDKGYTYGIHSYLQNHLRQSAWVVSTEAGREVSEATIKEVYHEMERLRNEPVSEQELLLVKNYLLGMVLGDLDGPFQIMSKWKNIILNNLGENYFDESMNAIREVTTAELQELANKYLQPENFYEVIVY